MTGVNLETDELVFFPFLYWPLSAANPPLSPQAAKRVNDYLHHGGMILFDSGASDESFALTAMKSVSAASKFHRWNAFRKNTSCIAVFICSINFRAATPAAIYGWNRKSFRLTTGVASVIAGSGNWAGAWAVDDSGRPLFPCTPDGEEQREYAYRFGVNIVMYALTGNYKSDQLHTQALLEKLGK